MVKSTIALTSTSFATSARMNAAAPPSCWISATTFAPSFSRRPERTTLAPAQANSVAVVLPMPEVPPVTSATLFENFFVFIQFPFAVVEFPNGETATSFFRGLVLSATPAADMATTAETSSATVITITLHLPDQGRACEERDPIEFGFHNFGFLIVVLLNHSVNPISEGHPPLAAFRR